MTIFLYYIDKIRIIDYFPRQCSTLIAAHPLGILVSVTFVFIPCINFSTFVSRGRPHNGLIKLAIHFKG